MAKKQPAAKPAKAAAKSTKGGKAASGKAAIGKPTGKSITKSALYTKLAEKTELSRKQVVAFFTAMREVIGEEIGPKGPGVLTLPGMVKLTRSVKPPVPAGPWFNPITKQTVERKAKPAQTKVKVRPLKDLQSILA